MQTRSSSRHVSNPSSNPTSSTNPNLKGRNCRRCKQRIENLNLDDLSPRVATMADQRTMAQLLQAPTKGYEDAIVVPAITADNFELKHGLLTLVHNKQFFGHDKEDPHAYVRYFNKITSTSKFLNVPNTSIKLMLFPFSLEGAARIWLEKEPPRSIFTWDDLVLKFINQFFPLSKTTNLRNEITNFQQLFDESFSEAWDRFKDLLRACPHHGFSKLHQLDTFYNALISKDQDSLNFAVGVSTNSSTSSVSPDVAKLKDMVKALLLDKKSQNQSLAPVKAVEESCVLAMVLILTVIVQPPMATIIKKTFKNLYLKPPQLTTTKEIPAIILRCLIKFDLLVFLPCPTIKMFKGTIRTISFKIKIGCLYFEIGSLPSNMIANSKSDLKAITTRSVLISKHVTSLISEPAFAPVSALKPNPKALIPYPSRRNNERNREKANNQIEKFYQIFKDMSFEISFADALILMPKFTSTLKALIGNKEKLSEMARTSLNEHCSAVLLKKLPKKLGDPDLTPTCMTLELADRLISRPVGVAEDVYVKEVLGFSDTISSGNPNPYYDSIVSATSSTLTLFRNSDFLLEEVDAFLVIEDEPTSSEFYQSYLDPEGHILLLEAFLNDDPSLPPPNQRNYMPEDQEKTTFTCPYGTFAYPRMPFGLCNAPGMFQSPKERQDKHFRPIHYASKTMTEAESNYTMTEKEMLVVVHAFEKFRSYLILNKIIVYTDHSALKYLFQKKDSNARLLQWVLLLQEFTFKVIDTKGAENVTADHLSRLENPHQNVLDPKEINESFPIETLNLVSTRGENHASWLDKLDDALLLSDVFHISWKVQINELNELHDQAYENYLVYKEKKRLHDSKIKNRVFNIGDRVLLFNSRLKIFSGKLKSCWSGPLTISQVYPYGTVELSQPDGPNFKVNGHRVKHYFGEDVPKLVVLDLQTFAKDH
uniref:Reverse transcriptase domain-containing protein n=1 Tax=Tanacetum cinerariifolium TaxID=118510 RepID=A0A6L2J2W8_TANCI|nr:reverse transcriptase domain-containing protein [Tanacetum cinerariifolium]